MAEKEDILTKTYDLLKYLIPQLVKFPRNHKFVLGDRIESELLDLLENLVEAYYTPKPGKLPLLRKVNLQLEKTRYLIRLCHDLALFDHRRYGIISGQIDEIGRMTGGWIKKMGTQKSNENL